MFWSTKPKSITFVSLVFTGSEVSFNVPALTSTFTSPETLSRFSSFNTYLIPFGISAFVVVNDFLIVVFSFPSTKTFISFSVNPLAVLFKNSSVPSNVISVVAVVTGFVTVSVHTGTLKSIRFVSTDKALLVFGVVGFLSFNAPAGISTFTFPVLTSNPFTAFNVNV